MWFTSSKKHDFVRLVSERAVALVANASAVVAIGYRFAEQDRTSFDFLLSSGALQKKPLYLVSIDAVDIAKRLTRMCDKTRVMPVGRRFREWADSGFRLDT